MGREPADLIPLRRPACPLRSLNLFVNSTDATMAPTATSLPKVFSANGAGLRVCILRARWNDDIINALVDGCLSKLTAAGVKQDDITIETVPGSYELPYAAKT
jgi:hypothetical protein